mmetsp:Transcript_435/g.1171  ORF Transcript_435/g.1171 Transcript_435/m.1171 type:complete len:168 (-) Transcript_435:196-699(-)
MFHASVLLAEHADACFSRIAVQALLGMPLHDPPVNRISLKKLPPAWATDADPHKSLARTYQACAASADFGNKGRRGGSFTHLYMPHDGRGIEFTHEARKLIPKAVLDDIRSRNGMDTALHAHGMRLLDSHLASGRSSGTLKQLPDEAPRQPTVFRKPMAYKVPRPSD